MYEHMKGAEGTVVFIFGYSNFSLCSFFTVGLCVASIRRRFCYLSSAVQDEESPFALQVYAISLSFLEH